MWLFREGPPYGALSFSCYEHIFLGCYDFLGACLYMYTCVFDFQHSASFFEADMIFHLLYYLKEVTYMNPFFLIRR